MMRENVADQLVVDQDRVSAIPTGAERLLRKRSDKMEPTLIFTEEEMTLAQLLATQGLFKRGHFDEPWRVSVTQSGWPLLALWLFWLLLYCKPKGMRISDL